MRTVWRLCWLTTVAVSLILATPSFATPSFNCASATQPDEIAICGSARLSELDDVIAAAYAWLKTLRGRPYADQIAIPHWRARQACQSDARCIEQREIEEIKAFQALGAPVSLPASPAGLAASAPSFDCSKAKRADETAICGDPRLGELDRLIAGADDALRSGRGRESADAISIRFWYQRGACQSDASCVGKVQIEELEAFQAAGVSVDLPFWARPAPTYQPTPIHVPTPAYTPTPVNTPTPSPVVPAPTPVAAAGCDGSKRVAMVIGEGAYRGSAALANPANDADDIARLLREKLCFQTILVKDADFETLSAGVGELAQAAEGADVALFYFSGHGMQFQQVNYLLPTDARLANEYDLVHRSISAQDIVTLLAARAKVVLVFLDACRSDPIEDDFRRRMAGQHREIAPTRGLAPPRQTGAETMIVYATRPNEIAADGTGRNSPFTHAFLDVFATPDKDIELVLRDMAARVSDLTNGAQVPQRLTELRHGLVLTPRK
jgi:uncharacterized protein